MNTDNLKGEAKSKGVDGGSRESARIIEERSFAALRMTD
jgi:hypothetical protein